MTTYRLFMFTNGGEVNVVTRGEDLDQAMDWAGQSPNFQRGTTISHCGFVPINAARLYDGNHSPGWLHRPPEWVRRKEIVEIERRVRVGEGQAVISELITSAVNSLSSKLHQESA